MILKIKGWINQHEAIFLFSLAILFVLIRLPATDFPLHQDEYKWPQVVNPAVPGENFVPHPPLGEFIYRIGGRLVGFDVHFRYIPLFFGALNLLLLYYMVRSMLGKREAVIADVRGIHVTAHAVRGKRLRQSGALLDHHCICSTICPNKDRIC